MTFDRRIIGALRECKNKGQVEDVFSRFKVVHSAEKQRYLIYAMYAPSYFFSSKEPLNEQIIYEALLCEFISGFWRLTPLYEKLGLAKEPLSEADSRILEKLNTCALQQDIDAVFECEGMPDLRERCNVLRRCMGIQEILGDIGVFSEQDDYEFDCAVFLEGSWRRM